MLWKCCTQYASKTGNLSIAHRTGKGQFSFQYQRKAIPKNAQTTAIALISHVSKVMLKILPVRLQQYITVNFQMLKLYLEKAEEPEIKLPTSVVSWKKSKRVPEKHLLLLYWLHQNLWLCGSQQIMENSSRDGHIRPPDLPPEKSVCRSRNTI